MSSRQGWAGCFLIIGLWTTIISVADFTEKQNRRKTYTPVDFFVSNHSVEPVQIGVQECYSGNVIVTLAQKTTTTCVFKDVRCGEMKSKSEVQQCLQSNYPVNSTVSGHLNAQGQCADLPDYPIGAVIGLVFGLLTVITCLRVLSKGL